MERRYYHDEIGVNSRLDSIQAAILRIKLRRLDEYSAARQAVANYYNSAFANNERIETPFVDPNSDHVYHQYTLKVPAELRDDLQQFLASKEIPAMIYYPVPLHLQQAYKSARCQKGDLPVTEELSEKVISLPVSTEMDEEQLAYIANSVNEFIQLKEKV
jgi:UDP-2-acetamido-2-deoxy-ribo-hexuluronate aminotransferase